MRERPAARRRHSLDGVGRESAERQQLIRRRLRRATFLRSLGGCPSLGTDARSSRPRPPGFGANRYHLYHPFLIMPSGKFGKPRTLYHCPTLLIEQRPFPICLTKDIDHTIVWSRFRTPQTGTCKRGSGMVMCGTQEQTHREHILREIGKGDLGTLHTSLGTSPNPRAPARRRRTGSFLS